MLDMLVIDKEAHEVSMKEAGAWTAVWITLPCFFPFSYGFTVIWYMVSNFSDLQEAARRYASHLKLPDPNDFEGGLEQYRHHMTISYITGYLIEKTLSVDNLCDDDDFYIVWCEQDGVSAGAQSRHSRSDRLAVHLYFSRCHGHCQVRLDIACLRSFSRLGGIKMFFERDKEEQMDVTAHPVVKFLSVIFVSSPFPRRCFLCEGQEGGAGL